MMLNFQCIDLFRRSKYCVSLSQLRSHLCIEMSVESSLVILQETTRSQQSSSAGKENMLANSPCTPKVFTLQRIVYQDF